MGPMNVRFSEGSATATAHPVQGLLCAHGYRDATHLTLPVESVFVSIQALAATISFSLFPGIKRMPEISSGGISVPEVWYARMSHFVDRLLNSISVEGSYTIEIAQNFDSGTGVGSSAAVFAAVTQAVAEVLGLRCDSRELSTLARMGSHSAAAAVVGNVSTIRSATSPTENYAEVLTAAPDFPYRMILLPVAGEKYSTEIHSDIVSSPFYSAWLGRARELSSKLQEALIRSDLSLIEQDLEGYIYENFAAICTGPSHLLTWNAGTLARIAALREIRRQTNLPFFISMNSGPAVFAYVRPAHEASLTCAVREAGFNCRPSTVGGGTKVVPNAGQTMTSRD